MNLLFLDSKAEYLKLQFEIDAAIRRVLGSGCDNLALLAKFPSKAICLTEAIVLKHDSGRPAYSCPFSSYFQRGNPNEAVLRWLEKVRTGTAMVETSGFGDNE